MATSAGRTRPRDSSSCKMAAPVDRTCPAGPVCRPLDRICTPPWMLLVPGKPPRSALSSRMPYRSRCGLGSSFLSVSGRPTITHEAVLK